MKFFQTIILRVWKIFGFNNNSLESIDIVKFHYKCFLDLPIDIFRIILEYLTLPDLGRLDKAILNHAFRSFYLSSMKSMILYNDESFNRHQDIFIWLNLRDIRPKSTIITGDATPWKLITPVLYSLTITRMPKKCEIGFLPSLKKLDIKEKASVILEPLLNKTPELRVLMISRGDYSLDFYTFLSQKCRNLLHFVPPPSFNDASLESMLSASPLRLQILLLEKTSVMFDISIKHLLRAIPTLHILTLPHRFSVEIHMQCLHQITIPSLQSFDCERQFNALDSLSSFIRRVYYSISFC